MAHMHIHKQHSTIQHDTNFNSAGQMQGWNLKLQLRLAHFNFPVTYLRAHKRRYEAVFETAPSTNSMVCINWCTKTSLNSNSSWLWESWFASTWRESSVLWSGVYDWPWCLWRNMTIRIFGKRPKYNALKNIIKLGKWRIMAYILVLFLQ